MAPRHSPRDAAYGDTHPRSAVPSSRNSDTCFLKTDKGCGESDPFSRCTSAIIVSSAEKRLLFEQLKLEFPGTQSASNALRGAHQEQVSADRFDPESRTAACKTLSNATHAKLPCQLPAIGASKDRSQAILSLVRAESCRAIASSVAWTLLAHTYKARGYDSATMSSPIRSCAMTRCQYESYTHSFSRLSTAVASLALFCFDCPSR